MSGFVFRILSAVYEQSDKQIVTVIAENVACKNIPVCNDEYI